MITIIRFIHVQRGRILLIFRKDWTGGSPFPPNLWQHATVTKARRTQQGTCAKTCRLYRPGMNCFRLCSFQPSWQRLDPTRPNGHRGDLGSRALGCLSAQVGDRPREKGCSQAENRKTYGERRKTVSAMKLETSFFDFFVMARCQDFALKF